MWSFCYFWIFGQNRDCGYLLELPHRGSSNRYPQSMFYSRNKKNNVYPCKPHFFYIKVGFEGVKITQTCFRDGKEVPAQLYFTYQGVYSTNKYCNIEAWIILQLDTLLIFKPKLWWMYIRTSIAWTPMAQLQWFIQSHFWVPKKFFQ